MQQIAQLAQVVGCSGGMPKISAARGENVTRSVRGVPAPVAEPGGRHRQVQPLGVGVGGGARGGQGGIGFASLGDVDAEAMEPERRAVFVVDRASAPVHPAPAAVRVTEPELDDVVRSGGEGAGDRRLDTIAIVRMHEGEEPGLGAREAIRGQAEDLLEFAAPPDFVGRQVARPRAHPAGPHRQRQHVAAFPEPGLGAGIGDGEPGLLGEPLHESHFIGRPVAWEDSCTDSSATRRPSLTRGTAMTARAPMLAKAARLAVSAVRASLQASLTTNDRPAAQCVGDGRPDVLETMTPGQRRQAVHIVAVDVHGALAAIDFPEQAPADPQVGAQAAYARPPDLVGIAKVACLLEQ